jgi:hypothetical protein
VDVERLRTALASLALPRAADGRLVLAVDVSPWLRPDAATCPDRSFCHTYGRGDAKHGRTSWTAILDTVRLEPGADLAAVTTTQLRTFQLVDRVARYAFQSRAARRVQFSL